MILTANPPPNNKFIIARTTVAGPEVFSLGHDGELTGPKITHTNVDGAVVKRDNTNGTNIEMLNSETIKATVGIELTEDSALGFVPFSSGVPVSGALYRFGRSQAIGDPTPGLNDGILMQREIQSEDQEISMQLHPSEPFLSMSGTKDAGVDWIRVEDESTSLPVFAIHHDGQIQTPAWSSGTLPDAYHESGAFSSASLYIGTQKLWENAGNFWISHLKPPPHIPVKLTGAPFNLTVNNIDATLTRSINDWLILARSVVSVAEGRALRLRDIFPPANHAGDWDDSFDVDDSSLTLTGDVNLPAGKQFKINGVAIGSAEVTEMIYIDSSFGGGSSDGSVLAPYSSLGTALNAKLVDGSTTSYVFKLMPGTYTGHISITHTAQTQSFAIVGSGQDCTIVQGGSNFAAGKDSSVLFFRRFNDVEIRDVTIRYGAYGWYPRDTRKCVVDNVRFTNLGSNGNVSDHDFSGTAQSQANFWSSSSTSDGGATRIRSSDEVQISNCQVDYNFAGSASRTAGQTPKRQLFRIAVCTGI